MTSVESLKPIADRRPDEVLDAVAAVIAVLEMGRDRLEIVEKRAQELRAGRSRGLSYAELVTGATGPLVIDVVSELLNGLIQAGGPLRRAEARTLHAEGLSMDKIGRLLRVSRQRVSALIHSSSGEGCEEAAPDHTRSMALSLTDPELRMIAESLPHMAWVATPHGGPEYFNQQGTEYTGMPRSGTDDQTWVIVVHPDDWETCQRGWERAIQTGMAYELDCRLRRYDGQFRWHRCRSRPLRSAGGAVMKWIGTATDIDDQIRLEDDLRRAERAASESLALLEALYAAAPVGFGLIDEEFRIVRMNQHLAAVNGAPLDDQIGRTVAEVVPDLWPTIEPALRQVLDRGEAVANLEVVDPLDRGARPVTRWLASYYPIRFETGKLGIGLVVVEAS